MERALSVTGRVATALLAGERGLARLETISGIATCFFPISSLAEASTDFGCTNPIGRASLTDGTRLGRAEGSGFCVVLGLSAWVIIPGTLGFGFEDFGANAIAGGSGREMEWNGRAVLQTPVSK